MQIFVKNIKGEAITLTTVESTVDSIKETIQDLEGIPVEYQRLIFEGKEMEDGQPLSFYNVKQNNTVHLMLRLPGGYPTYNERRLTLFHNLYKKICRKCYGRLPMNATHCRKAKCGRTHDIRMKKAYWFHKLPKKLSDWTKPYLFEKE